MDKRRQSASMSFSVMDPNVNKFDGTGGRKISEGEMVAKTTISQEIMVTMDEEGDRNSELLFMTLELRCKEQQASTLENNFTSVVIEVVLHPGL
ncbi:hypothetical protein ACH5RR_017638 [Cinchona calisaya]|uniref:Uncharacterized protein n=1 Tax=Cinchona calisaya TaxID=153742 RepID=A0ABD2ZJW9_9GENT